MEGRPLTRPFAIVGAGCVFPGATDVQAYSRALLSPNSIAARPPPPDRWDWRAFHDERPTAVDKGYSPLMGIVDGISFDPKAFGLEPELADDLSPVEHWYLLSLSECVGSMRLRGRAGVYAAAASVCEPAVEAICRQELTEELLCRLTSDIDRDLATALLTRAMRKILPLRAGLGGSTRLIFPLWRQLAERVLRQAVPFVLMDAACTSSFYAIEHGMRALAEGAVDTAIAGGAFYWSAIGQVYFSKLSGLSRRGCRPFDVDADGTVFGDGAGFLAIRRLEDALQDGDEVLAVIRGIGTSSDGKGKAVYAPNARGQTLALQRAYAASGIDPRTIQAIEAHATGTPLGDTTELGALIDYFGPKVPARSVALGSVKGLFGHLGWAASIASVLKLVLAFRHRTIMPQQGTARPLAAFDEAQCPFFLPTKPSPWPENCEGLPRRAATSGFGFGGTNAHLVLEEFVPAAWQAFSPPPQKWEDGELAIVAVGAVLPGGQTARDALERLGAGERITEGRFTAGLEGLSQGIRMMPRTLRVTDPSQLLILQAAREAVDTLGLAADALRESTEVYIGVDGPLNLQIDGTKRIYWDLMRRELTADGELASLVDVPKLLESWRREVHSVLPPSAEDSFPGIMANLLPGRISNALDLRGSNQVICAGRGSFVVALEAAAQGLRQGSADMALVGAVAICRHRSLEALWRNDPESPGEIAEGAFVFGVMLAERARSAGAPILARLSPQDSPTESIRSTSVDMLGATGAMDLLRGLADVGRDKSRRITMANRHFQVAPSSPRLHRYAPARIQSATDYHSAKPLSGHVHTWPEVVDPPASSPGRDVILVGDLTSYSSQPMNEMLASRCQQDIRTLQAFSSSAQSGDRCGVLLLSAIGPGGVPHPSVGIYIGILRSLALEQPSVTYRILVCDHRELDLGLLILYGRFNHDDVDALQIRGSTFVERLIPAPEGRKPSLIPRHGDVVVAFGGGQGITHEVAAQLGDRGCHLVLVGRTPLTAPMELKPRQAWLEEARQRNPHGKLRVLNEEYNRLLSSAQIAKNIATLRARGFSLRYATADASDRVTVANVLTDALSWFGRVDGVLYGASANSQLARFPDLEPGLMGPDFGAKVVGLVNVLKELSAADRPMPWVCVFGSIASMGSEGLATYAGNNVFQNFALEHMRLQWPDAGLVSINWPAWGRTGATARYRALMSRMAHEKRVSVIEPDEGQALFFEELERGFPTPVVYLVGSPERRSLQNRFTDETKGGDRVYPILGEYVRLGPGALRGRATFSLRQHPWLQTHLVEGDPVVPGTCLLELAAEATLATGTGGVVVGFDDARFERYVKVFEGSAAELDVTVRPLEPRGGERSFEIVVKSDFKTQSGRILVRGRRHFSTIVRVSDAYSPAPPATIKIGDQGSFRPIPDPYHLPDSPVALDGVFITLQDTGACRDTTFARTRLSSLANAAPFNSFIVPALLLDGALRSGALQLGNDDTLPVLAPVAVAQLDIFGPGNDIELTARHGSLVVHSRPDRSGNAISNELYEASVDGVLVFRARDVSTVVLSRIASAPLPHFADRVLAHDPDRVVFERSISMDRDPYLSTAARLDNTPVLPASFLMEAAAEAATFLQPNLMVSEFRTVRFVSVLKLHPTRQTIVRTTACITERGAHHALISVDVHSLHPVAAMASRQHAVMTVHLMRELPSAPPQLAQGLTLPDFDIPTALYRTESPLRLGGCLAVLDPAQTDGRVLVSTIRENSAIDRDVAQRHVVCPVHLGLILQFGLRRRGPWVSIGVPQDIERVRFFANESDCSLTDLHGPLSVRSEAAPGGASLSRAQLVGQGHVLIEVEGLTNTRLGWMDSSSGRFEQSELPPVSVPRPPDESPWSRYGVSLVEEPCASDDASILGLEPEESVDALVERIAAAPGQGTIELLVQAPEGLGSPLALGSMLHTAGQAASRQTRRVRIALESPFDEPGPALAFASAFVESLGQEVPHFDRVARRARGERRTHIRLVVKELGAAPGEPSLGEHPVILLTGGARGITAALAERLQTRFGAKLVLLGRSSLDEGACDWPEEFSAFLVHYRKIDQGASVAKARRAHERFLAARESLCSLIKLRSSGDVTWISCDLRDATSVAQSIKSVLRTHNRVDAVVHGAGLERSAPVASKLWEASSAVIGTKVQGLTNLLHAFGSAMPQHWVLLSSVLAVIGMDGSADYAGANAWLGQAAGLLCRRDPTVRVRCVSLPLVGDRGMAAQRPEVIAGLRRRGHRVFQLTEVVDELVEAMAPGPPWTLVSSPGPLSGRFQAELGALDSFVRTGSTFRASRRTSEDCDPCVRAHLVDGVPCFPGAAEVELALQAVRTACPDRVVRRIENVAFHRYIKVFPGSVLELRLEGVVHSGASETVDIRILTDVKHRDGRILVRDRLHWSAKAILAAEAVRGPNVNIDVPIKLKAAPIPHYLVGSPVRYTASMRSVTWRAADSGGMAWGRCDTGDGVTICWADIFPWELGDAIGLVPYAPPGVVSMIDRIGSLEFFAPARLKRPREPDSFFLRATPVGHSADGLMRVQEVCVVDRKGELACLAKDLSFRQIGTLSEAELLGPAVLPIPQSGSWQSAHSGEQ
jgi:3-oxoacyl-(acyl-carrier-protein) synthase/NAD(P)-dependent dehydrogenase (short-subunit alcohol dehydrogenase family)